MFLVALFAFTTSAVTADTITVDADLGTVSCVFRGRREVADARGSEIDVIFYE